MEGKSCVIGHYGNRLQGLNHLHPGASGSKEVIVSSLKAWSQDADVYAGVYVQEGYVGTHLEERRISVAATGHPSAE